MLDQHAITYRRLTVAYVTALAMVAAVLVGSTSYVAFFTEEQRIDAAAINVSGRQRMLSQRIAFFAQSFVASGTAEDAALMDSTARFLMAMRASGSLNRFPSTPGLSTLKRHTT